MEIAANILVVGFLMWAVRYIYRDAKRWSSTPEGRGNANVLFFALICGVVGGIIVFLNIFVLLGMLPGFQTWSFDWIK